jgi:peptide methionine sulfoxide reductase MsrA
VSFQLCGVSFITQIVFNPAEVSYDTLLDVFFSEHMPIRKSKPQYKSAVWTHNEEQSKTIKSKIKSIEAAKGLKVLLYVWFNETLREM